MEEHIKKLVDETQTVLFDSKEYWKLRCKYIEEHLDPTYPQTTRDNCFMLWRKLTYRHK